MSTEAIKPCPICETKDASIYREGFTKSFVECPTCGRFEIMDSTIYMYDDSLSDKDKIASYLYYNGKINKPLTDERFFNFIGPKNKFEETQTNNPWCFHVTKEVIDNWYPKTFSDKIDMFLLGLAEKSHFISEPLLFSREQLKSACFMIRHPDGPMKNSPFAIDAQITYFLNYLEKQEYIESDGCKCVILPKGLEKIEALQKNRVVTTKNVFIAMSFAPDMEDIRDAIKNAISKVGFIPRIMNEIEHNHQIVPEMLYEIREAKFVIAELTGHNNGAYFEAGYALGLGKEVIHVCKKEKFGEDGHFDVKQVNTILWETTEDLTNRLVARIKATIN